MPKQSASYDRAKYVKFYPVGMIAILLLELTRAFRAFSPSRGALAIAVARRRDVRTELLR
jgi:hypothetical protein